MNNNQKVTKYFSKPLMKQNIKSNYVLFAAILIIMCLMTVVTNYATSIMGGNKSEVDVTGAQKDFYSYLYVMASYNEMAQTHLSYDDFEKADDKSRYEGAFEQMNQQSKDMELSVDGLESCVNQLKKSDISVDTYVHQFEYTYALGNVKGCFSEKDLDPQDMMETMFETMGVDSDMMTNMTEMDTTAMFNQMDYTVMGLMPILIFIVIVGNSLMVDQVDRGSMAYILSTPTKRSAVTNTQAIFLIAAPLILVGTTCAARLISSFMFYDNVEVAQTLVLYLGMYILVEAIAGICYMGSCFCNQSKKAMAFGGGLTVWFFLASLLGMFGSKNMVSIGFGVDALGIFNKLTLIGLYDIESIATIGTGSLDTAFIWKLCILAAIAVVFYVVGAQRFKKKDLPL